MLMIKVGRKRYLLNRRFSFNFFCICLIFLQTVIFMVLEDLELNTNLLVNKLNFFKIFGQHF